MLSKNSLFELIKTLDIHEKRYLMSRGKRAGSENSAYTEMLDVIYKMDEYDENELRKLFASVSKSGKLDVKKHFLYYWILNNLNEYHSTNYQSQKDLQNIQLLLDRSLIGHVQQLISKVKKEIIKSENYLAIISLLEKELILHKYKNEFDSLNTIREIEFYSNQYRDLKYLEFLKLSFRKIIDYSVFARNEEVENEINSLFNGKINKLKIAPDAFLLNFNYNLLFYWKFGSENKWSNAYKYALKNYKLLDQQSEIIKQFPEHTIHVLYNLLNASSINGRGIYPQALKKMKVVINSIQNKRVRADGLFYLYLSKLIYLNQNKTKLTKSKLVDDAGYFIEKNKTNFSNIRLNNFYFDLAKSHFYRGEYKKAFSILNEMYQNYYSKDYTTDFNLHARFLFCFICFELGEKELLKSTALSIADFMKRNRIVFKFEKKMIRFIRYDLTDFQNKSFEVRQKKLKSLKSEITTIFESKYERKVLNYFDYFYWIDSLSTRFNK